jgi:hypothetical protein
MKTSPAVLAVLATLVTTASAFALPNDLFQGKPDFTAGGALGAWVWHDADGQHVRFTTVDNKVARHFTGKVCGAEVTHVDPVRTDVADGIRVGPDGHCVVFDFTTNAGVDGFDFRMPDSGEVVYDLKIDGEPLAPKQIHIGKTGISPKKSPFVMDR